jgi:Oxidoreductase family, NAD-binding Rossmann fold/Oxidoreductase family, C-terminal alpha/beta domain/TAT (twin-arginine translocation) pathway signal sequence
MRFLSRRDFLKDSAALAAAVGVAGPFARQLSGAEPEATAAKKGDIADQLRVAVIGVNGRGMSHVSGFAGKNNCIVSTICDADTAVAGKAVTAAEKAQGLPPKYEQDLRKVMEDKEIDIVAIATPNHWHALAAIWAMQAGKDVYVEKPVSHNVSEGRRIVEAARKYNKICQTGTQSRSGKGMREAMQYLHDGKLGKIHLARGLCYKLRGSIGKSAGEQPIPKTIDYDLWCGPAPKSPLMRKNLHYDWHWIWDYGNGDLGNQGIHEMDKARWGLNKAELPKSARSIGGRFGYEDDGQTANTQVCVFDYGDCELIFEVRGLPSRDPFPGKDLGKFPLKPQNFVGNVFYGSEGVMVCPSYTAAIVLDSKGDIVQQFKGGEDHFGNFVKAVRSRKMEDLNADILEGHLSSALCHLGNISYRLGSEEAFDKKTKAFGDDKDAGESLEKLEEHFNDHMLPLDSTKVRVGKKLAIIPKTESFSDDKVADKMLTRDYRKGFVVPEKL